MNVSSPSQNPKPNSSYFRSEHTTWILHKLYLRPYNFTQRILSWYSSQSLNIRSMNLVRNGGAYERAKTLVDVLVLFKVDLCDKSCVAHFFMHVWCGLPPPPEYAKNSLKRMYEKRDIKFILMRFSSKTEFRANGNTSDSQKVPNSYSVSYC